MTKMTDEQNQQMQSINIAIESFFKQQDKNKFYGDVNKIFDSSKTSEEISDIFTKAEVDHEDDLELKKAVIKVALYTHLCADPKDRAAGIKEVVAQFTWERATSAKHSKSYYQVTRQANVHSSWNDDQREAANAPTIEKYYEYDQEANKALAQDVQKVLTPILETNNEGKHNPLDVSALSDTSLAIVRSFHGEWGEFEKRTKVAFGDKKNNYVFQTFKESISGLYDALIDKIKSFRGLNKERDKIKGFLAGEEATTSIPRTQKKNLSINL